MLCADCSRYAYGLRARSVFVPYWLASELAAH